MNQIIKSKNKMDFIISDEVFLYMKLLANRFNVDLEEYQKEAFINRLRRRLRVLNIKDVDAYCQYLRNDIEEEEKFINIITNNTTSFFRENHHFEYLQHTLLPELVLNHKKRIRIWSAGCSTGEEPYSIAMIVLETIHDMLNYDIKILASDINTDALFTAEQGIYSSAELKNVNVSRQKTWFIPSDSITDSFIVSEKIKKLITFTQLNIMDTWPMKGRFDIIFCRNMLIYFKSPVVQKILDKFHKLLPIGGILIIGHSENLFHLRDKYLLLEKTIYRKLAE